MKDKNKFDLQEFLTTGKEATEFNAVTDRLIKKASEELIDEKRIRQERMWSSIGNKFVGSGIRRSRITC